MGHSRFGSAMMDGAAAFTGHAPCHAEESKRFFGEEQPICGVRKAVEGPVCLFFAAVRRSRGSLATLRRLQALPEAQVSFVILGTTVAIANQLSGHGFLSR